MSAVRIMMENGEPEQGYWSGIFVSSSHRMKQVHDVESPHEIGEATGDASWTTVALLEISDVIGVGILAMGAAFALLGWVLGVIASGICLSLCVYLGIVQWEVRNVYKGSDSQTMMAKYVFQNKYITGAVAFLLYSLLVEVTGSLLLVLSQSLSAVVGDKDICSYTYMLIGSAVLLPLAQIRQLSSLEWLVRFNCLFIVASVLICVVYIVYEAASGGVIPGEGTQEVVVSNMTVITFFQAVALFALSYCGLVVYLEMIAEMKDSSEFPKTFWISAPVELFLFLLVCIVSYWYQGVHADNLLTLLPEGTATFRVVNALLFCYILIAYVIKSVILTRAVHLKVSPHTFEQKTLKAKLIYFGISFGILFLSFMLASAIPMFSVIVGFAGSIQVPLLGYILPVSAIIKTRRDNDLPIKKWEWGLWGGIAIFAICLIIFGTISNILELKDSDKKPFQC